MEVELHDTTIERLERTAPNVVLHLSSAIVFTRSETPLVDDVWIYTGQIILFGAAVPDGAADALRKVRISIGGVIREDGSECEMLATDVVHAAIGFRVMTERGDEVRFVCRGVVVLADVLVRFLEHYSHVG